MAHRHADLIRDISTTTGTGNITVSGSAPTGYRTFSAIPSLATSDTFYYAIRHQTADEWELGVATWEGANAFARTSVLASSNADALVNFSAGTKDCYLNYPAAKQLTEDALPVARGGTGITADVKVATIQFVIDGGGAVITTGVKCDITIPFACTINEATLLADQSGSIVIDVWKDSYANYPPTDADSITASAPPTLSTATKSTDATLTGWTTSITAGDTLRFNVDSASTVTRVTLALEVTRT